jgi:hypothetical protein
MGVARKRSPVPLGALVGGVVRTAPVPAGGCIDGMTWQKAVGYDVSRRTRPIRMDKGVLQLRVATSAWAQELALLKKTILARLREHGIKLDDIRFQVGTVEPAPRPMERRATKGPRKLRELPDQVKNAILRVEDEELRAVLTAAAATNLAWQRDTERAATSKPQGARALRSSAGGSAPSDRSTPTAPAASRDTRGSRRD